MDDIEQTFQSIFDDTKTDIYRYIAAKCRCIDDIDDIFQDTYMGVYVYLKGGGDIDDPSAFTKTVAKRTLIKYYNLVKRLKLLEQRLEPVDLRSDTHSELIDLVNELIMKKNKRVQRVFFMRNSLQLTFDEIAKELGIKTNTVQKIYYRTVEDIRRRLEKEELL